MGKSLRSKIMRKHRAEMRRTIGEPARLKQIEQSLSNLEKEADERSGESILKLRSAMGVSQAPEAETSSKVEDNESEQAPVQQKEVAMVTETRTRGKAYKSSQTTKHQRPQKVRRIKPKTLQWFK